MRTATIIGSDRITSDPTDILIHYALGDMPSYTGTEGSSVVWQRPAHRGVHLLQRITFPRSQRRYVLAPDFDFRINTAFEPVVRGCADLARKGHTWIMPQLVEGYIALHDMGLAHSFESWQGDQLVGGCFGVQMGGWISIESMFYRVSHASKAAYGRALMHLKDRGFALVDSNPVQDESLNYGEEWIPHWRYELLLRDAIARRVSMLPGQAPPVLPWQVRQLLPVARFVRKLALKIRRAKSLAVASAASR